MPKIKCSAVLFLCLSFMVAGCLPLKTSPPSASLTQTESDAERPKDISAYERIVDKNLKTYNCTRLKSEMSYVKANISAAARKMGNLQKKPTPEQQEAFNTAIHYTTIEKRLSKEHTSRC